MCGQRTEITQSTEGTNRCAVALANLAEESPIYGSGGGPSGAFAITTAESERRVGQKIRQRTNFSPVTQRRLSVTDALKVHAREMLWGKAR